MHIACSAVAHAHAKKTPVAAGASVALETEVEMRPAVVSGIITRNALVSYWPILFPCPW